MVTADVIGWIGTACLVLGYAFVSARSRPPGLVYQLLNLAGAAGLIVNGAYHGAWPSVGLNAMWLLIGTTATIRLFLKREKVGAEPREKAGAEQRNAAGAEQRSAAGAEQRGTAGTEQRGTAGTEQRDEATEAAVRA